jgi:hypothetical protein
MMTSRTTCWEAFVVGGVAAGALALAPSAHAAPPRSCKSGDECMRSYQIGKDWATQQIPNIQREYPSGLKGSLAGEVVSDTCRAGLTNASPPPHDVAGFEAGCSDALAPISGA